MINRNTKLVFTILIVVILLGFISYEWLLGDMRFHYGDILFQIVSVILLIIAAILWKKSSVYKEEFLPKEKIANVLIIIAIIFLLITISEYINISNNSQIKQVLRYGIFLPLYYIVSRQSKYLIYLFSLLIAPLLITYSKWEDGIYSISSIIFSIITLVLFVIGFVLYVRHGQAKTLKGLMGDSTYSMVMLSIGFFTMPLSLADSFAEILYTLGAYGVVFVFLIPFIVIIYMSKKNPKYDIRKVLSETVRENIVKAVNLDSYDQNTKFFIATAKDKALVNDEEKMIVVTFKIDSRVSGQVFALNHNQWKARKLFDYDSRNDNIKLGGSIFINELCLIYNDIKIGDVMGNLESTHYKECMVAEYGIMMFPQKEIVEEFEYQISLSHQ